MDNKFFMIHVEGGNAPVCKYSNREDAESAARGLSAVLDRKVFIMASDSIIEPVKINIKVDSYKAALEYLGKPSKHVTCSDFNMIGVSNKHTRAITAIYQLITIAEAWNKADEFVPDFDNTNQYKWFPWFRKQGTAGFVSAGTNVTATGAFAYVGSRLCFESEERATQFGKQFIDLWNDFLLFR